MGGPRTSGSAVAVFEDYKKTPKDQSHLAVVLFRDKKSKKYEHGGGGCDPREEAHLAGKRELLEESRNLLRIPSGKVQSAPFQMTGQYRVHAIKVAPGIIRRRDFEHNVNAIEKAVPSNSTGKSWREMDKMCRVYIFTLLEDGFLSLGNGEDFKTHDTDGNPVTIRDRDSIVLLKLLRGDGNRPSIFTLGALKMKRDNNYIPQNNEPLFLWGTRQYYV